MPEDLEMYRTQRRSNEKLFQKMESDFYLNTLFTPLRKSVSKPFFSFYRPKCGCNGSKPVILKNKSDLEAAETYDVFFFQSVFSKSASI